MKSIEWLGDSLRFIDQSLLPFDESYVDTDDYVVVGEAIRSLKIRGAPLIGIAAAYGIALSALKSVETDFESFSRQTGNVLQFFSQTRPTAVNLFWALGRMKDAFVSCQSPEQAKANLIEEAIRIHSEDKEMCRLIGEYGNRLVPSTATILTICNTGALATGGDGTAQSVITSAFHSGKTINVFACETRPALQGARLTTWELMKVGIDVTLITDNMAATLMKRKTVDLIITGADRIARNGDSANKIGTYMLAVLAHHHNIPFYIAAPTSTIDTHVLTGEQIPIEERNPDEVKEIMGRKITPSTVQVWNPSFDVTPSGLISAIITDRGVFKSPYCF